LATKADLMFVHSTRILKQLEYLSSLGISTQGLYDSADFTREETQDPDHTFSLEQFIQVLEFALEQTGDRYYGLKMGQEPHVAGTIGMLCASCKNLKQAFVQGCKYFQLQGDFAEIEFRDHKMHPAITYAVTQSWHLHSRETARHEVDAMFAFLATVLRINSNSTLVPYRINLSIEAPPDPEFYEQALGIMPHFSQAENEMIFNARDLLIPMKAFNPETYEVLKTHVESRLKQINNQILVSEKVKTILLSSLRYSFPDMETVASRLNVSSRTLQRMLSNENTSFKSVLQDTRHDLARNLLKQNDLSISEISFMLGYSDLGNFSRSFKRHSGTSPQEYRNKRITKHK
jgi:AraC-like DNA-binding protein